MIHKSEDGNPAAEQQLLSIYSTRGIKMGSRRGPVVRLHGLSHLDEALAIKKVLQDKGLDSAVTLNPGDFEYYIRIKNQKPFSFEVKIPVDFNIDEARLLVNNAVVAEESELEKALDEIKNHPSFSTVADEMIAGISSARHYLQTTPEKEFIMNHPETTTQSTNESNDMNKDKMTSVVAAANNQTTDQVLAAEASNNTRPQETTNDMSTTTETIEIKKTVTNNAGEVVATETKTTKKFLGIHKKHIYLGAAAVAAVGLGVLGWKNADKIGSIFKRTPV